VQLDERAALSNPRAVEDDRAHTDTLKSTDTSVHAGGTGTTLRIIVTGGNSGIGKATAGALAAAGHSVVIACQTIPKAEQAAAEMTGNVEVCPSHRADAALEIREGR
jgi:NADPH:quinone reductase-like Zn-dependent oxidoreductase